MFRELLGLFGPQDHYAEIHAAFMEAFRAADEVFNSAHEAFWKNDSDEATAKRIYARDVTVNKKEREVRKRLVRHLSVQQGLDILYSLRLMSIVKDVERIGDYGKNLFEVGAVLLEGELDAGPLRDELKAYGDEACAYLDQAMRIFDETDESAAVPMVAQGREMADRGEEFVKRAAAHDGSANSAVCFALLARHYKRVVGHAMNVLTALTMPIHALDYFDEDRKR